MERNKHISAVGLEMYNYSASLLRDSLSFQQMKPGIRNVKNSECELLNTVYMSKTTNDILKGLNNLKPSLNHTQLYMLELIRTTPDVNLKRVAFELGVSSAAVTGARDRLVELGLVQNIERGSVAGVDRRNGGVKLLPKGLEVLQVVDNLFGITSTEAAPVVDVVDEAADIPTTA